MAVYKRAAAGFLIICMFSSLLTGCKQETYVEDNQNAQNNTPDISADPVITDEPKVWASYISSHDEPFAAKDIADKSMYYNGIVPIKEDGKYRIEIRGENDPSRTIVLKGEYGKCYEIKFLTTLDGIRVARVNTDPRTLTEGSILEYTADDSVRYYDGAPGEKGSKSFITRKATY